MLQPVVKLFCFVGVVLGWNIPNDGYATMTHYDLPKDAIAACGCTAKSDHYPSAALSDLAFNGSAGFGPACGRCFRLQLINTIITNPPWYPTNPPSIVIKVTDKCPNGPPWCNGSATSPNAGGETVNFDLAWPSVNGAIPDNWYPSNESYYGYTDYGVWRVSYTTVACEKEWAGAKDPDALGSVRDPNLQGGVCCPADPITYPNTTCPSSGAAPTSPSGGGGGGSNSFAGKCTLIPTNHRHGPIAIVILLLMTMLFAVLAHVFLSIPSA